MVIYQTIGTEVLAPPSLGQILSRGNNSSIKFQMFRTAFWVEWSYSQWFLPSWKTKDDTESLEYFGVHISGHNMPQAKALGTQFQTLKEVLFQSNPSAPPPKKENKAPKCNLNTPTKPPNHLKPINHDQPSNYPDIPISCLFGTWIFLLHCGQLKNGGGWPKGSIKRKKGWVGSCIECSDHGQINSDSKISNMKNNKWLHM